MSERDQYKNIFKTTFLFGFVQVFNILAKVGVNKAVAIFLGAEGMGVIGLYQSAINILKTVTGLGISQSAVRDISQANGKNDKTKIARIITITNRIIWISALLGAFLTLCLSSYLSLWTFGNSNFTIAFIWLSIVVFFNVLTEGQLAILKGMRQLKALAKATLIGSFVGLIAGIPFYYFFDNKGIIPSLVVTALASVVYSSLYVRKIKYAKTNVGIKDCMHEGSGMIKMGVALMYVSFVGFVSEYVIRAYIGNSTSLEMVGIFQAGSTIVTSYFGIVITAMTTDYYPRISAVNYNNNKLTEEVNRQSEVGLLLLGPLIIAFMFLMPYFIKILYTEKFLISIDYVVYAVFGVLITVCSNAMGMILIAKQKVTTFVLFVTVLSIFHVAINIGSYKYFSLKGLGVAYIVFAIVHFSVMQYIMKRMYRISFNKDTYLMLLSVILFCIGAFFIKDIADLKIRYGLGGVLFSLSVYLSCVKMKKHMGIDIWQIILNKIGNR